MAYFLVMCELHNHLIDNCRRPNHPMDWRCFGVTCRSQAAHSHSATLMF